MRKKLLTLFVLFSFIELLLLTGCKENKFQDAAQKEIENCEIVFKMTSKVNDDILDCFKEYVSNKFAYIQADSLEYRAKLSKEFVRKVKSIVNKSNLNSAIDDMAIVNETDNIILSYDGDNQKQKEAISKIIEDIRSYGLEVLAAGSSDFYLDALIRKDGKATELRGNIVKEIEAYHKNYLKSE